MSDQEIKTMENTTTAQIDITGVNFQGSRNCARERWGEQAAAIGMTIEEIIEGGKPRAGAAVAATAMLSERRQA